MLAATHRELHTARVDRPGHGQFVSLIDDVSSATGPAGPAGPTGPTGPT